MTNYDVQRLKSIVAEFNHAANQPILENTSMSAEDKIYALAEIVNLADIMASYIDEIIHDEIPEESLPDENIPENR